MAKTRTETDAYAYLGALSPPEAIELARAVALARASCLAWRAGEQGVSAELAKQSREAFRVDVFPALLRAIHTPPACFEADATRAALIPPASPPQIGELRCASCGDPPFWLTKAQADATEAREERDRYRAEVERLRAVVSATAYIEQVRNAASVYGLDLSFTSKVDA